MAKKVDSKARDQEDISSSLVKAKTIAKTSLFTRLAARFKFGLKRDDSVSSSTLNVKFIKFDPKNANGEYRSIPAEIDTIEDALKYNVHVSNTMQEYLETWLSDNVASYDDIRERIDRDNELEFMYLNEPYAAAAVDLIADETTSAPSVRVIRCISDDSSFADKTTNLINDAWQLTKPRLHSIAFNLWLYGDAFLRLFVNSNGIQKVKPMKASQIVERLEFNMDKVDEFIGKGGMSGSGVTYTFGVSNIGTSGNAAGASSGMFAPRQQLFDDYIEYLHDSDSDDVDNSYLLGFRGVNDRLIMPWNVLHFRYDLDNSEFFPYGRPPMISCLQAAKQVQTEIGIDGLRKSLSMPFRVNKVKTNGASTSRAMEIVNRVREEVENTGITQQSNSIETPSLTTNIWTSDDLFDPQVVSPSNATDSNNNDSIKLFQDRVCTATRIPKTYLDASAEGFQVSGVALSTLHKPFQRLVQSIRDVMIETITDAVNLHYSIRGEDTPKFSLVMQIDSKESTDTANASLQLADAILGKAADLLGVEAAALPIEVKRDVLTRYTCLNDEEIENWINIGEEHKDDDIAPVSAGGGLDMSAEGADLGGGGFEGGGDFGPGPESAAEALGGPEGGGVAAEAPAAGPEMPESYYHPIDKKHLIERRYGAMSKDQLLVHLSETFGSMSIRGGYVVSGSCMHDQSIESECMFLREERDKTRSGKKRISG